MNEKIGTHLIAISASASVTEVEDASTDVVVGRQQSVLVAPESCN